MGKKAERAQQRREAAIKRRAETSRNKIQETIFAVIDAGNFDDLEGFGMMTANAERILSSAAQSLRKLNNHMKTDFVICVTELMNLLWDARSTGVSDHPLLKQAAINWLDEYEQDILTAI